MKKSKSILFVIYLFSCFITIAQSIKMDKKMEKVYDLVDKNKLKDADELLEKILKENSDYGTGWDYLAKIRYQEYKDAKKLDNLFGKNITITTTDKDGNKIKKEDDTLGNKFLAIMDKIKPSKMAYDKYIFTLRKGILLSNEAEYCSMILRNLYVDVEVDTLISKKALRYFDEAEEEFAKKNYSDAAKSYKRAIEAQPLFYKAGLYLGDCFYFVGDYVNAISSFKTAKEKFPSFLEPRKYLTDAFAKAKLYDKALDECIESMSVYPDIGMAIKLEDAAYYLNKKTTIKWTPRGIFPISNKEKKEDEIRYVDTSMKADATWKHYEQAYQKIKSSCNSKGIITKPVSLTNSKYMEVYAWEEMLKNSEAAWLESARKMQKDGFLDCYVLVSCFHIDFYDQYLDFVKTNKNKLTEYYNKYLVAKN